MEQFSGLRKFLLHNNIDPDLSIRVTRFLKHTFTMKHKALSKDGKVAILDMLSKSLHEELEVQRHNECLQESGFLYQLLLLVDVGQTRDELWKCLRTCRTEFHVSGRGVVLRRFKFKSPDLLILWVLPCT